MIDILSSNTEVAEMTGTQSMAIIRSQERAEVDIEIVVGMRVLCC